jgi:phage terminase small subunit
MKELKVRQEKFCQAYVLYRNATESAKIAGYSEGSAHTQGHRLLQREDIKQRIEELEKEVETRIDVVSEIENQYTYAKNNGHTNSAIKALEVLSRIRSAKEDETPKSIAELEQEIVKYLEVLGEDETSKLFLKCDFFDEEDEEALTREKVKPKHDPAAEYRKSREGHVLK